MADQRRVPSWKTTNAPSAGFAGTAPGKKSRGWLRFALLAAALAIVGVVAGLIMFLRSPKKPIFLSIAVTEYVNRGVPPNPFARQDGDALRATFGKDSVQAFQSQERDLILRELAQLADRTTTSDEKNRPVIVHLCAYAVIRDNTIYLLSGFSQPDSESTWLPLGEVFDALRRCAGGCLLLLDVARPVADSRLGFLSDDASSAIDAELKQLESAKQLPFLVLTSSSSGEVSHSSLVLRRSAFGFFVEQGLRGLADGWDAGKNIDGQVSARELAGYVRAQVVAWAAQMRLSAQTPEIYGAGTDFVLITPPPKPSPPALPDPPEAYPEWLTKSWVARDRGLADETWRATPRTFRHLESALLRAEARWIAGDDVEAIQRELQASMTELDEQRRHLAPAQYPPYSLAQVNRKPPIGEQELRAKLQAITDRLQNKAPFAAGEIDMLWQKAFEKPPAPPQNDLIAAMLFQTLAEIPDPSRDQLKAGLDVMSKLQPKPRHLELLLLQLLVDLEPAQWKRWETLPGTAHAVLLTCQLAEQIAAGDHRILAWLRDALATGDALRRDGLLQLTIGEAEQRRQGRAKLDDAVKQYQTLFAAAQTLEKGLLRLEEAYRLLPAVAPELGRQSPAPSDMQQWSAAAATVERLQQLLTPPARPQLPATKEIESLTQDLTVQLNYLQRRYAAESLDRQLRRLNTPNAPSAADLFGQLRSPAWDATQRARLYAAAAKLERELAESAIARAGQLKPGDQLPANSEQLRDAPAWRARLAIDLLKLDGLSDTQALQAELAKVQGAPSSNQWQKLGAKIRSLAALDRVKRFTDSRSLPEQTRAGWFIGTADFPAVSTAENEPFPREPAAMLRRREQSDFWRWLGEERYVKDANVFLKIATRPELAAYGRGLNEIGRDLPTRNP